jgi:hypothetical protein
MRHTNALLSAAFVLVAAFGVTAVAAQPAGSPSGMSAGQAHKAEKAGPHALDANKKAHNPATKADDKRDKLDAKAAASAEPGADGGPTPADSASPLESARKNRYRGRGFRALGIDFQHGVVKKEELQDRIKAMHAARLERKKEHRAELRARWGPALNFPSIREELRHHARREAFLSRMMFVAETEVTGKKKEAMIARIEKLIDKENERHERAMQRLKSNPIPPASASAAAPGSASAAAPASSAPAAASAKLPKPAHSAGKAGAQ